MRNLLISKELRAIFPSVPSNKVRQFLRSNFAIIRGLFGGTKFKYLLSWRITLDIAILIGNSENLIPFEKYLLRNSKESIYSFHFLQTCRSRWVTSQGSARRVFLIG